MKRKKMTIAPDEESPLWSIDRKLKNTAMIRLAEQFELLAKGLTQIPNAPLDSHLKPFIFDPEIIEYHDHLIRESGPLFKHFLASVPYVLEELCRVGVAISRYVGSSEKSHKLKFNMLEADAFDGSNARALVSQSKGRISSLTTSPNVSNLIYFEQFQKSEISRFFPKSILELTPDILLEAPYQNFSAGFDFIYEMAAFQFYDRDRRLQINHIKKLLKPKGIVFFLEKLNHIDVEEYARREALKDKVFKSRYFTDEEISWKQEQMLNHMQSGQVTLAELSQKVSENFRHAYLIWNSTNFYEIVASDDNDNIQRLMKLLGPVVQSEGFCFELKKIGPLYEKPN